MRTVSKCLILLLVLCLFVPITAMATEADSVSGTTWIATQYSNDNQTADFATPEEALEQGAVVMVRFADDGTYQWDVIHADGTFTLNGDWVQNGDEVSLKLGDTDMAYTLKAGENTLTYSSDVNVLFQLADDTALTAIATIEASQDDNRIPPVAASSSDFFSGTYWYATGFDWDLIKKISSEEDAKIIEALLGFATFVRDPAQLSRVFCGLYLDLNLYSDHTYSSKNQSSILGELSDTNYSSGTWSSSGNALFLDGVPIPFYYGNGVLDISIAGLGLYMQQK